MIKTITEPVNLKTLKMVNKKKSNRFRKLIKISLIIISVLAGIFYLGFAYPLWGTFFNKQRHGNPPLTPAWALECWLWEDDYNTAEYVDTLLEGYKNHDSYSFNASTKKLVIRTPPITE